MNVVETTIPETMRVQYKFGGEPHRLAIIGDPYETKHPYFNNAEPGLQAFIDYSVNTTPQTQWIDIGFVSTENQHRGQGMARQLIQALYDKYPGVRIYWGRIMEDSIQHLKGDFRQRYPDVTARVVKSDYNGWTNWETWNTSLMMNNDEYTYNEARRVVERYDYDPYRAAMALRDWAVEAVIGPSNASAMADAQEWNDIPEYDRLDPYYEDLKERNPQAADLVNNLGFGPDVSDYQPQLIDPELVNWEEITENILDWIREDNGEEVEYEDADSPGSLTIPQEWTASTLGDWENFDWSSQHTQGEDYYSQRQPWWVNPETNEVFIGPKGTYHPSPKPQGFVMGEYWPDTGEIRATNWEGERAEQAQELVRRQLFPPTVVDENPLDKAMREYQERMRQAGWEEEVDPVEQEIQKLIQQSCPYCGENRRKLQPVRNSPHEVGVFCSVCKNGTYWDPNPDMLPSRWLPKDRKRRHADADGWYEPAMTNLNEGVKIPGDSLNKSVDSTKVAPNEKLCTMCKSPIPMSQLVCPYCGVEQRYSSKWEGAPALYGDPDPSNNWLYLQGKVAIGDNYWAMADRLGEELGLTEEQARFISNQIARNHLVPEWDIAYGEIENGKPRIWASTIDRNHVWDVVKGAIDEHARV